MSTDPLLQRLQGLRWPSPAGDRPDPAVGQVWVLAWANVRTFGLLTAVTRRTVDVTFLSTTGAGDENTVEVPLDNAGLRLSAWLTITGTVRRFALDQRVGDLTPGVVDDLAGQPRRWAAISSVLDDRALVRAELEDDADELTAVEWLPDGSVQPVGLVERAQELGLGIADVRAHLGLSAGAASRLLQRRALPTDEQTAALAELLQVPLGDIRGHLDIDPGLVDVLDRPAVRPALRLIAGERFGGDEQAARLDRASRTLALAARHQVPGETDWETLLNDALHDG